MGLLDRFRRGQGDPALTGRAGGAGGAVWSPRGLPALHLDGAIPGPVIPFSDHAFCIASGRSGSGAAQSVIAAVDLPGGGRLVGLGHDGIIDAADRGERSAQAVMIALLTWASRGSGSIGVVRRPTADGLVRAAGLRVVAQRDATDTDGASAMVVRGDLLDGDDDAVDALEAYVRAGGGVVVDSTPWGWLQLHGGSLRDDHGANRLMRRFGLCFADGLIEPSNRDGAFALDGHEAEVHGAGAVAMLRRGRGSATATETLINLADALDRDHPFRAELRDLAGECDPFAISPSRPVRADDHRTRLAAQLWVEDWQPEPAVMAFGRLGASVGDAGGERVTVTAPAGRHGWVSTGRHARPGERITVRVVVPNTTIVERLLDAGISVRIGAQTDQLWHAAEWKRFPDVASVERMDSGTVSIANPFGGLVYLDLDAPPAGPVEFEIEGGIPAPRFVLGSTTPEEWRSLRAADAPWSEIEGRRFVLTVPSWATRTLQDPAAVCAYWDEVLGRCHELAGVPDRARPERYVCDVQISHGYLHAGYPVMGHDDIAGIWADPHRLRAYDWNAAWALFHETGHNFQEDWWTFDGTVEVTCNLFSLYCAQTVHGRVDDAHPALIPAHQQAAGFKRRPSFETWKADPFLALESYRELIASFGWDAVKAVIASYRDPSFGPAPTSDDDARDQWAIRFSQVVRRDLSTHFDAWGIPISSAARRRCGAV